MNEEEFPMDVAPVSVKFDKERIDLGTTTYTCRLCGATVTERIYEVANNRLLHARWHGQPETSIKK